VCERVCIKINELQLVIGNVVWIIHIKSIHHAVHVDKE